MIGSLQTGQTGLPVKLIYASLVTALNATFIICSCAHLIDSYDVSQCF